MFSVNAATYLRQRNSNIKAWYHVGTMLYHGTRLMCASLIYRCVGPGLDTAPHTLTCSETAWYFSNM
jgi:hypothetical protein